MPHELPTRLACAIAGLLLALPAQSAPVDSRIDRVTVFPGELARVERVARLEAPNADGELAFDGLPAAVVDGSVRLSVESGRATLGSVEIAREPVGEPNRARQRELEQRIEDLRDRRQAALDRATAARSQITFIEGLSELPRRDGAAQALAGGDESPDRWARLWERIGSGSQAAHERLREHQGEAERLKTEIDTLERRLRQLGQERSERVAVRTRYTDASGPLTLRLRYRVRGPRWEPVYAARLDTEAGRLTVERKAVVRQATGEDWRDVALRLSTVRPVRGDRPRVEPWWIDLAGERDANLETSLASDRGDGGTGQAAPEKGAEMVQAAFAATYVVNAPTTVPAGNDPREVVIGADRLNARVGVEVFPQQDQRAWLTAEAAWSGEGPLPAGEITRYRDGAYVGEGRLDAWSPGESRTLAFGIDPRVDVRFEPVRDTTGESGWITSESTRARQYRLVVTNRHARELPVKALFRVPVPREEAISVDTEFSTPPTTQDVDGKRGVHAWETTLAADEERTWSLGYSISYPAERDLQGL